MENNSNRGFNCKIEELPVVCGFVALSLERDLTQFSQFSPVFTPDYLVAYKAKIEAVKELIAPQSETVELKLINEHTYSVCDGLIDSINHLEGYIQLAGASVPISATDFGLTKLRKNARAHEVESVMPLLLTVDSNITKYYAQLMAKGLTDALKIKFSEARVMLANDKNTKYSLISNRAAMVQNNMGQLNELYANLVEICDIGKILFKLTDKAKLKDYTFVQLMKKVRRTEKPEETKPKDQTPPADTNPET